MGIKINMFGLFGRKKSNAAIVKRQYELLTNAARRDIFYTDLHVPDTVMGRFNLLTIHLTLYLRMTRDVSAPVNALAQDVVDAFFEDIDHSIRELGIGDASVPKRMKKLAKMFYGRAEAYGTALDANDKDALIHALARNLYPEENAPDLSDLAHEMLHIDEIFGQSSPEDMAKGNIAFPDCLMKTERSPEGSQ